MFSAPQKLLCVSDDNELSFVMEEGDVLSKGKKNIIVDRKFTYEFTKSITKLNTEITFTENELKKLIVNSIFKEI